MKQPYYERPNTVQGNHAKFEIDIQSEDSFLDRSDDEGLAPVPVALV